MVMMVGVQSVFASFHEFPRKYERRADEQEQLHKIMVLDLDDSEDESEQVGGDFLLGDLFKNSPLVKKYDTNRIYHRNKAAFDKRESGVWISIEENQWADAHVMYQEKCRKRKNAKNQAAVNAYNDWIDGKELSREQELLVDAYLIKSSPKKRKKVSFDL